MARRLRHPAGFLGGGDAHNIDGQPFLKLYDDYLCDLDGKKVVIEFNSGLRRVGFDGEDWFVTTNSSPVGEGEILKSLVYSDSTHATLTENGYTYTFVFGTGQTVYVEITPQPLDVE